MKMHSADGDLEVTLTNVAFQPGARFRLLSLHEVMPKCSAMMDAFGVHRFGGKLTFPRGESGSYVKMTRIRHDLVVATAVLAPGKMPRIDINDLHVAVAHLHADTCRETAHQVSVKVSGELVACSGFSEAKGRKMAVPCRTECRSRRPLERLFVDLSGRRPPPAGGADYLMMVVDDYSRLGWPYVLKRKSDVPLVFAHFLPDIGAYVSRFRVGCIRSDIGLEFINPDFVGLLDRLGIRREYTPVSSPKHDGVSERRIAAIPDVAMASCLKPPRLFGGAKLPPTGPLWAEACHYASDVTNMTARVKDKPDMLSPYRDFYGRAPFVRLLQFLKPGFRHVSRTETSKPKAQPCFYLSSGSNHAQDCCKVLLPNGYTSYTRDVAWEHPRKPFVGLLPAGRMNVSRHRCRLCRHRRYPRGGI